MSTTAEWAIDTVVEMDGYDLQPLLNKAGLAGSRGNVDTSTFGQRDASNLATLRNGVLSIEGFRDIGAIESIRLLASGIGSQDANHKLLYAPEGDVFGKDCFILNSNQNSVELSSPINGVVMISAGFQATGGPRRGVVLHGCHSVNETFNHQSFTLVFTAVPTYQFLTVKDTVNLDFSSDFVLNTAGNAAGIRAAVKAAVESLDAYSGTTVTVTGTLTLSTGTWSGTLLVTVDDVIDYPLISVLGGKIETLTVAGGDTGNYTADGGGNFTLGVNEATLQTNQRTLAGQHANVIVKGISAAVTPEVHSLIAADALANATIYIDVTITPGETNADIQTAIRLKGGNFSNVVVAGSTTQARSTTGPVYTVGKYSLIFTEGMGNLSDTGTVMPTGTNRGCLIFLQGKSTGVVGTDIAASVTLGGVSLTKLYSQGATTYDANGRVECWYGVGIPASSNNLAIVWTVSDVCAYTGQIAVMAFADMDQSAPVNVSDVTQGSSITSLTDTKTTTEDNVLLVSALGITLSSASPAIAGYAIRGGLDTGSGHTYSFATKSGGAAGSKTAPWTWTGSGTAFASLVALNGLLVYSGTYTITYPANITNPTDITASPGTGWSGTVSTPYAAGVASFGFYYPSQATPGAPAATGTGASIAVTKAALSSASAVTENDWSLSNVTYVSATANGTAKDGTVDTDRGYTAQLHVIGVIGSGASIVVKVQHSDDNAIWSDLITFSSVTAVGVQRVESVSATANVKRYIREVVTFTGSGSTYAYTLGFARQGKK